MYFLRRSSQLIIGWLCSVASALSAGGGDTYANALQSLRLARMRILAEGSGVSLRFVTSAEPLLHAA